MRCKLPGGYAGGNSVNARGVACYNDYAQLGHTEAALCPCMVHVKSRAIHERE